ncbi:unnamed protein product [Rotaria socialis]|uniref:Uncharacterized protein n=1 Tax=Rotaria socialis TaxID=392032 RepID=A0A818JA08_9BILA|nr:unnamed protein product [Rotaria socialis]CAF4888048.1 unnamed protein product [Rotaria socialis]
MALPGIRPMQFDDISTTSSMLPEFNYEDVTLVWLDENVNESFDCLDTKCRLSAIVNYFKVFDNVQETIDYIRSALREHLFLIVSGSLGEMLIANVNDEFQLKFIYVFCMNKEKHSNWSCKYEKICGVFSDKYELFQNLTLQVRTYEKSLLAMSIFNRTRTATVESSTRDYIIEEDIGLMWLLMFFNILLHIPLDKNVAKQDMIAECRLYYNNNPAELKKIDEFENDYSPEMAIKWYTRDSFVYRLVNKALRTLNIDIIFKFRFLIIDLHQQLKQYHTNYIQSVSIMNPKRVMHKVYRSQHMGISKLEKLKTSVGNLICSNSFFSTTDDCLIAQAFVAGSCSSELILFEIEIPDSYYQNDFDALKVSCPFLKIEKLGQFEAENEVIFSLGALFRIESIEQYDIWYVRLKFEGEKDELTSDFHELEELEIGDYDWQTSCNVEDRILLLTEKFPPSSKNILNVYIKHGVFADAKSLTTTETLTTYRKGFELLMKCLPNYNSQITIAMYLSIGLLYCHRGERILAIQFGEVALQLAETCLRFDHDYALICYNYLGVIHRLEDQYTEALSIYEKMLSMAAEQNNTSALLAIYYEICSITCDFGDYDYEMICLVKIVELSRALGCENSKDTYYNFGTFHEKKGNFAAAFHYYKKYFQCLLQKKPCMADLIRFYFQAEIIYEKYKNYIAAIQIYIRMLIIELGPLPSYDRSLLRKYETVIRSIRHLIKCKSSRKLRCHFRLLISRSSSSTNFIKFITNIKFLLHLKFNHPKSLKAALHMLLRQALREYHDLKTYAMSMKNWQSLSKKILKVIPTCFAKIHRNTKMLRELQSTLDDYGRSFYLIQRGYFSGSYFDRYKSSGSYSLIEKCSTNIARLIDAFASSSHATMCQDRVHQKPRRRHRSPWIYQYRFCGCFKNSNVLCKRFTKRWAKFRAF